MVGFMPLPRKPGSQVAPNQRPMFTDGRTASTHSKVPLDQATAGKTYRVRDKDWAAVWGMELSYADALKLKETVVGARRSTTARVEDEAIPPPDWYLEQVQLGEAADASVAAETSADTAQEWLGEAETEGERETEAELGSRPETAMVGVRFVIEDANAAVIPGAGVVDSIPVGHELLVNGAVSPPPVSVRKGDIVQARPVDPQILRAQALARQAVSATMSRTAPAPRPAYRDKTVRASAPRTRPAPRDRTVSKTPPVVRLGLAPTAPPTPPPSPLRVATQLDGAALPDEAITDADLPDIAGDIGGGPSEDDIAYAQRQREAEARSRQG